MSISSAEDRVAILLNLLGSEMAEPLLAKLSPARIQEVRRRLDEFQQSPPSPDDVDETLEEFDRYFAFAKSSGNPQLRIAPGTTPPESERYPLKPRPRVGETEQERFEFSDDPIADLSRLEPFQIAGALKGENPRTIALVLSRMDAEEVAKTLPQLPDDVRGQVFMQLKQQPEGSGDLVDLVIRTTVEKGATLDRQSLEKPDSDQKLADLLRSMDEASRTQMLDVLSEEDPDTAVRVKELLYVFDDLLKIEDRSLQKLLGEIDSPTLATALKEADQPLVDKLLGNLSKRARQTLTEEMEFMGKVDEATIEGARKVIVDAMAALDESGDLVMES